MRRKKGVPVIRGKQIKIIKVLVIRVYEGGCQSTPECDSNKEEMEVGSLQTPGR